MKQFRLSIFFLLFVSCTANKEIFESKSFATEPIPIELRLGAHSVIRNSETLVNVLSTSETEVVVKKATTIFEKENKDAGRLILHYDPLQEIEYIKANIVNSEGNVIQSFTESDALDFSSFDGFSFFSDNRVKILDLNYGSFPYTVEIEYRMKYNGGLFLPNWYPQLPGQGVQKASFKVIDHTKGVRYFSRNIDTKPSISDTSEIHTYEWNLEALRIKESEYLGPPVQEILPYVSLAPSEFVIENTQGNASSWKEFGKWYFSLSEGTRELSVDAIQEIEEVVSGIDTEQEKIKALYNYLQDKARYVSIQLGIGGWKPFPASYVFENEYGDCKALTNYMQAILDHFGIESKPVLIRRGVGEPDIISDFSSNQFNHVLLRVELGNGEIMWLECTSKYFSPGHIGSGNEDRHALLVDESGGTIIKTPKSEAGDNISSTSSKIDILSDGKVVMSTEQKSSGVLQENLQYALLPISNAARVEWLENRISKGNFKIVRTDFDDLDSDNNSVSYSYVLNFDNYTSTTSSRIFVPLETLNSWSFIPDDIENREQEVIFPFEFSEKDSSLYVLPEGFEIESMPSAESLDYDFASYNIDFEITDDGNLLMKRELIFEKNELPAESYKSFREFFIQVSKADNSQLVLVKKS